MTHRTILALTLALALAAGAAHAAFAEEPPQAGNIAAGEQLSPNCTKCHNDSYAPALPSLGEAYFIEIVSRMKASDHPHPLRASLFDGLSEQDIADLAAYFASLE